MKTVQGQPIGLWTEVSIKGDLSKQQATKIGANASSSIFFLFFPPSLTDADFKSCAGNPSI